MFYTHKEFQCITKGSTFLDVLLMFYMFLLKPSQNRYFFSFITMQHYSMATGDMLPKISEEGSMTTLKIVSPRGKLMEPSPSQRMVIEVIT